MITNTPNQNQRVIALDVGTKTCGIAVTDPMGIICQPVTTLRYKGEHDLNALLEPLIKIFKDLIPKTIVVGLPVNSNGTEGTQVTKVRAFTAALKKYLTQHHMPADQYTWVFQDEFSTSQKAHEFFKSVGVKHAKRKKSIDTMAAVFILQDYLDNM